jgi:hypothetical protein
MPIYASFSYAKTTHFYVLMSKNSEVHVCITTQKCLFSTHIMNAFADTLCTLFMLRPLYSISAFHRTEMCMLIRLVHCAAYVSTTPLKLVFMMPFYYCCNL